MGCTVRPKRSANPMAACRGPLSGAAGPNSATGIVGRTRSDTVSVVSPRGPRALGERKLGALSSASCSRFLFFFFCYCWLFSPAAKTLRQRPRCFGETRHACAGMSDAGRCAQYNTAHSPSKTISRRLPTAVSWGEKRRRVRSEEENKRKEKNQKNIGDRLRGGCDGQFFWHVFETKRVVGGVSPETLGGSLAC